MSQTPKIRSGPPDPAKQAKQNSSQYTGFLNIYKEAGFTSHDVVAKLRGMLHQKKIGHTGTLDPDATGVLPIALGRATKAIPLLEDHTKAYDACLLLGVRTDTDDTSGQVITEGQSGRSIAPSDLVMDMPEVLWGAGMIGDMEGLNRNFMGNGMTSQIQEAIKRVDLSGITEEQIKEAILSWQGEHLQIPPMYSAKKKNGKKLYEFAREGIIIERESTVIQIHEITLKEICLPFVRFHVECSKGTYIRSLCRDIGDQLKCGGCMSNLTRTRAGKFSLMDSHTLKEVEEAIHKNEVEQWIIQLVDAFSDLPKLFVTDESTKKAKNGNILSLTDLIYPDVANSDKFCVIVEKNKLLGIYEKRGKMLFPRKVFAE